MPGTVISKAMNLGYLGSFSRNGDDIVASRPVNSTDTKPIYFGDAVFLNPDSTGGTYSSTQSLVALQTVGSTATSTTLTITGSATGIAVGQLVIGVGVAAGTTVTVVSGSTITLSAATTATATGVAITFLSANLSTTTFAGFAIREIKSFETYIVASSNSAPTVAYYAQGTYVDPLKRGVIVVKNYVGTPVANGKVYLRIALNASVPSGVIGGVEAASDGTNTIQVPNAAFFTGYVDSNSQVEVSLNTINAV
jgi:hypothetical protein